MGYVYNYLDKFGGSLYRNDDWDHYLVCFSCRRYSVFMIYIEDNEKIRQMCPDVHQGELILCSECVPTQDDYGQVFPGERAFREDSILNNTEILELMDNHCYNVPTFEKYADLDRLILTPNVMLKANYKDLLRRPYPRTQKIKVLMRLFPRVHRLKNQKYTNVREVIEAVKAKCNEIRAHYCREASRHHDGFDVMCDQTPRHQKPSQNRTFSRVINPVVEEQPQAADITVDSNDVTGSSANCSKDTLRFFDESTSSDENLQMLSPNRPQEQLSLIRTRSALQQDSSSESFVQVSSENVLDVGVNLSSSQGTQPVASQEQDSSGENTSERNESQNTPQISSESLQGASINVSSSQGTQPAASQEQDSSGENAPQRNESKNIPQFSSESLQADLLSSPDSTQSSVSSQEVGQVNPRNASDDNSPSTNRTRPKRRSTESVDSEDAQRPGPSRPKRTRAETPVNPSPDEYVRNPRGKRNPRLGGG